MKSGIVGVDDLEGAGIVIIAAGTNIGRELFNPCQLAN